MIRIFLCRAICLLATLGSLAPFLPGEPKDPYGRGGVAALLETNAALAALPADGPERSALLRHRGKISQQVQTLLECVHEVRDGDTSGAEDVVQAIGFTRNENWILAYDLYPVKVVTRPVETSGAKWTLTRSRRGPLLRKVR